jgi:hypothetical protein
MLYETALHRPAGEESLVRCKSPGMPHGQAYAVLGDKPSAMNMLTLSIQKGFFCYSYFLNDSLLDNLRDEPEYKAVIEMARVRHEAFRQKFL